MIRCDGDHAAPRCGDPQCWRDDRFHDEIAALAGIAVAPVGRLCPISPTYAAWRKDLVRRLALAERASGDRIWYSRRWKRDEHVITYTHVLAEKRFGLSRPPRGQLNLSIADSVRESFHNGGHRGRR